PERVGDLLELPLCELERVLAKVRHVRSRGHRLRNLLDLETDSRSARLRVAREGRPGRKPQLVAACRQHEARGAAPGDSEAVRARQQVAEPRERADEAP